MSHISDESFRERNLFGEGELMKLQWIRPDWPVCLLGHEAFKRPTCRALSCLSVIWVKLFLMHRAVTGRRATAARSFLGSVRPLIYSQPIFRHQDTRRHLSGLTAATSPGATYMKPLEETRGGGPARWRAN